MLGYHLERAYEYRTEVGEADDVARELAAAAGARLSAAGQRAVARDDLQSGVGLLRRAAALSTADAPRRVGLLAEIAPALVALGEIAEAESVLREIVRVADPTPADPLDALARTLGPGVSEDDRIDAAIEMATEAAPDLPVASATTAISPRSCWSPAICTSCAAV